jgi:hypothetical protein
MDNTEKKAIFKGPAILVLAMGIFISMIALVIYLSETDFSDEALFFILRILRYSSFFVCICSVYLLVDGILLVIKKPSLIFMVRTIMSFICLLYGAGIIIMDAFIISLTEGIG